MLNEAWIFIPTPVVISAWILIIHKKTGIFCETQYLLRQRSYLDLILYILHGHQHNSIL